MNLKQIPLKPIFAVSNLLMIVGALIFFLKVELAATIFTVGAGFTILVHLIEVINYKGESRRMERMKRILFLTSLLLAGAAYCMFNHLNYWVPAILIYALSTLVLSFRGE